MYLVNLKNFLPLFRKKSLLFLIVVIGFLLRVLNPSIGFPLLHISNDEASAHLAALNMIESRTIVSNALYAPLGAYLQIPFLGISYLVMLVDGTISSVDDLKFIVLTHPGYFLFIPRLNSALFGTLIILAMYKLTLAISKNRRASLIAALFSALSFNFVHISTIGRAWPQALFFNLLGTLFAVYAINRLKNRNRNIYFAYFLIGISYGFHQVGIFGFFLITFLLVFSKTIYKKNLLVFAASILFAMLMFVMFSSLSGSADLIYEIKQSHSFLRYQSAPIIRFFFGDFSYPLFAAIAETVRTSGFLRFFRDYFVTDTVIFMLFAIFIFQRFYNPVVRLILYFSFLFFVAWGFVIIPHLRYMFPVIIFAPVFAGILTDRFIKKITSKNLRFLTLVMILLGAGFNSFWWNYLILQKPTFIQVRDRIEEITSPSLPIAFAKARYFDYVPSTEALAAMRTVNPNFYKEASKYLRPGYYPDNVRNVIYTIEYPGKTPEEKLDNALASHKAVYVIDAYLNPDARVLGKTKTPLELVETISPATVWQDPKANLPEILFDSRDALPLYSVSRAGPYFDILKIKR